MVMALNSFVALFLLSFSCFRISASLEHNDGYGVDVSFPVHHGISTNYAWLPHNTDPAHNPVPKQYKDMPIQTLGARSKFYDEFLNGCRQHYGNRAFSCDQTEKDRLAMSVRQPQSMQNYTDVGFKKIRAPEPLIKLLNEHWKINKENKKQEQWSTGNTYTNHWSSPTFMVSVEDTSLRGGGSRLKERLWEAARETIEEWTGMEQTPTSLYGIRMYTEGAVLAPHVDRMPLVSSAIVNVDQDVDEDWPLEVYGRDGKAHNVTMKPGDMVLYESHSLIHGRPFPLKGRYFANIFIHFEPTGHSLRHNADDTGNIDVHKQYREAIESGIGGHVASISGGLPPYILKGSPEEKQWSVRHPQGLAPAAAAVAAPEAHQAAATGDIKTLLDLASTQKHLIHQKDANGWQPIHEAARGGHKEIVELLVKHGANVNERTNHGAGGTPLFLTLESHSNRHPLAMYLQSMGALNIGPDL